MATQIIQIGDLPIEVKTTIRTTLPPSLLITATYENISLSETFTVGPNNPDPPPTAEELQAAVDAFRNDLANRVATQYQLSQLVSQLT